MAPSPCRSDESFVRHVTMHVGKEIVPVRVSSCGRCSGGSVRSTAGVLLSRALHAFLAFLIFVTSPAHMMLAPIKGAILDFLFV